jgi:putative Holliday junction resolvase
MTGDVSPRETVLGFDFGRKRIGVAVGQHLTASATPLTTIRAHEGTPDWDSISALIEEWKPGALVVGIPYHMDGSEQDMTRAALRFGRQLEGRYHLPVFHADERLTSYAAEASPAHRNAKSELDPLAAQLILQDWLQERKRAK